MTGNTFPEVLHLAAFADGPGGGNMAGVVLDAARLSDEQMQQCARELGYSETAFVTTALGSDRNVQIRYFSPGAEVPFCGHATVATAVALAEKYGPGAFSFATSVGEIVLETSASAHGLTASFTTVEPSVTELAPGVVDRLLALLGLSETALDPRYPAQQSFTGNTHPILTVRTKADLDGFSFDAAGLRTLMDEQGWAGTVTVMWLAETTSSGWVEIESRNLFPVGDITEDPATGSAAASTGAYLRSIGAVTPPASLIIRQGRHVGRPCILQVTIPATGGITVSGTATAVR